MSTSVYLRHGHLNNKDLLLHKSIQATTPTLNRIFPSNNYQRRNTIMNYKILPALAYYRAKSGMVIKQNSNAPAATFGSCLDSIPAAPSQDIHLPRGYIPFAESWNLGDLQCTDKGVITERKEKSDIVFIATQDDENKDFASIIAGNIAQHGLSIHEGGDKEFMARFEIGTVILHPKDESKRIIEWNKCYQDEKFSIVGALIQTQRQNPSLNVTYKWSITDHIYYNAEGKKECIRILDKWAPTSTAPGRRSQNFESYILENFSRELGCIQNANLETALDGGTIRAIKEEEGKWPQLNPGILFALKMLVRPGYRGLEIKREPVLKRSLHLEFQLGMCYTRADGQKRILWNTPLTGHVNISSTNEPLAVKVEIYKMVFDEWNSNEKIYYIASEKDSSERFCFRVSRETSNENIEQDPTTQIVAEPKESCCRCIYLSKGPIKCSYCGEKGKLPVDHRNSKKMKCKCKHPISGKCIYWASEKLRVRMCMGCDKILRYEKEA